MSIIEFKYYELDKAIDERIEQSNDIRNEWGSVIFDSEGRLKSSEDFPLEPHTLLGIIQEQQEQITKLKKTIEFELKVIRNDIDFELRIVRNQDKDIRQLKKEVEKL